MAVASIRRVAVAVDATATASAAPTAPATDTVSPAGSETSLGFGPAAALLLITGLAAFALIARRPATSRVRQDEG